MARYKIDKTKYAELLHDTTISQYIFGTDEIMLDTDSEKDIILYISNADSFWRICKDERIIASTNDLFLRSSIHASNFPDCVPPEIEAEISDGNEDDLDDLFYSEALINHVDKVNELIRLTIEDRRFEEVVVDGNDLHLKLSGGVYIDVFSAYDTEVGHDGFWLDSKNEI